MHPFFEDYYGRLQALFDEMKAIAQEVSQPALDWAPGPEMNSLAVILAHTAGSTRYWIGDLVGEDPSGRQRPLEFETEGVPGEALAARLDAVLEHSRGVLERLAIEGLAKPCYSPLHDRDFSAAYCLFHVLEHVGQHLGHAHVTQQLWQGANEGDGAAAG